MSSLLKLIQRKSEPAGAEVASNSPYNSQVKKSLTAQERQFSLEQAQTIFARAQAYQTMEQAREEQKRQAEVVVEELKGRQNTLEETIGESTLYEVGQETCGIPESYLKRAIDSASNSHKQTLEILRRNGVDLSKKEEHLIRDRKINYITGEFADYVMEKAYDLLREKYPEKNIGRKDSKGQMFFSYLAGFYCIPILGQVILAADILYDGRIFVPQRKAVIYEEKPSGKKVELASINVFTKQYIFPKINIKIGDESFVGVLDSFKESVLEEFDAHVKEKDLLGKKPTFDIIYSPRNA